MSDIMKRHEKARKQSLKEDRCVKVHQGEYYYKGFNVSNDGGTECPWNYTIENERGYTVHHGYASTKKECISNIDILLKNER